MIYLIESYKLTPSMPSTVETFIRLVESGMSPFYNEMGAFLCAAWSRNNEHLFQVEHLLEFENYDGFARYQFALTRDKKGKEMQKEISGLASETECRLFEAPSSAFPPKLQEAMEESREQPQKVYTMAILNIAAEHLLEFIDAQEKGVEQGLPLVAFLMSVTGAKYQALDLWKGDLQSVGYQKPEFYDAIGRNEQWWQWIRTMGPREKLIPVYTLPYSPLL